MIDYHKAIDLGLLILTRAQFANKVWDLYINLPIIEFDKIESGKCYFARRNYNRGSYGIIGEIYNVGKITPNRQKFQVQKLGELATTNLSKLTIQSLEWREYDSDLHDIFLLDSDNYDDYLKIAKLQGSEISENVIKENIHLFNPDCPRQIDVKLFDALKHWRVEHLQEEITSAENRIKICKWLIDYKLVYENSKI